MPPNSSSTISIRITPPVNHCCTLLLVDEELWDEACVDAMVVKSVERYTTFCRLQPSGEAEQEIDDAPRPLEGNVLLNCLKHDVSHSAVIMTR
jgi:hypothetical protein